MTLSDLLKHVIVGDLIGCVGANSERRALNNPGTVFALAVMSHAVMDVSEPDYTVNWFNAMALKEAAPFLGIQSVGIGFVLATFVRNTQDNPRAFWLRLTGIVGAVIPDVIDGVYAVLNPQAWYAGRMLLPWHTLTWQVNVMSMWSTSLLSVILLGARYLTLPILARLRRRVETE